MTLPSPEFTPATLSLEHAHPRTEAALQRLRNAMREIEAEVATHQGVYPFNHGRVTQSELCRRADVKKATLQNPVHKDTTRVEIMTWLDTLAVRLTQTRDGSRARVTAVADDLGSQVQALTQLLQLSQTEVTQLQEENAALKRALQHAREA